MLKGAYESFGLIDEAVLSEGQTQVVKKVDAYERVKLNRVRFR